MGNYSAIKKNGILPSATTWMDLESIMLSKINGQRYTNTVWYLYVEFKKIQHLYVESKKYNKLVNVTWKKKTHRYREQTNHYSGEREGEREYSGGE